MGNINITDYVDISSWEIGNYMAAICCGVNLLIFTPIMAVYAYKYNQRRNKSKYIRYYQTRNVIIIRFWFLCNFYYISIHVILLSVIQFYFEGSNFDYYFSDFAIISFIFLIFVLRMWILYFNYMWSMSQLDLIWKRQINEQYSNWYLQHKKKFGSAKYCFFIILLPFYILLNTSLYIVALEFSALIWYAASFATVCILILFIVILNIKLERCHFADNYGIQEEMSRCAHFIILLFMIATALYFVFDDDDIREWMITISMSIGCVLVTIISSGGVIHIQDRQDRLYKKVQNKFSPFNLKGHYVPIPSNHESPPTNQSSNTGTCNHSSEIKSFLEEEFMNCEPNYERLKKHSLTPEPQYVIMNKSNNNNSIVGVGGGAMTDNYNYKEKRQRSKRSISKSIIEADAQGRLELAHVITNPKLLNVFAQFLCVEWNIEALLFIIEIVQFKRYIRENQNDCSSILGEYLSIPEHEDLPKFDRLIQDEKEISITNGVDVYMYAIYIINKYIKSDGTHEINIPGRVKNKIINQATNIETIRQLNMEKLQVLFDDAFVEILSLLQDPLSRFSSWEEFTFYLKSIGPNAYSFFPKCSHCIRRSCCCCWCWCCNPKGYYKDYKRKLPR
eukprot:439734_1